MNIDNTYRAKNLSDRRGAKVEFIVLHDTAGNGHLGDVKYLANDPEKRGIGVDYAIPKSGVIYQLNPDPARYSTGHAGRRTRFRDYVNGQVNRHSIGIEIGQLADMSKLDPKYPDVQVKAVADLCVALCRRFSLSKTDITTHSKIITDGSRTDPRQFPWDKFWAYFNGESVPATVAPDSQKIWHTVVKGDTLYALSQRYLTSVEKIKALNNMNTASMNIKVGQKLLVKE